MKKNKRRTSTSVTMNVIVDRKVRKELDRRSIEQNCSLSWLANQAIEDFLKLAQSKESAQAAAE